MGLKPGIRIEWLPGDSKDEFRCRILPESAILAKQLLGAGRKYLRPDKVHPLTALEHSRAIDDADRERAL